jgi:hypothetical protein
MPPATSTPPPTERLGINAELSTVSGAGPATASPAPEPVECRQYNGIQSPKYQKPHPPNAGLNTGIAVKPA